MIDFISLGNANDIGASCHYLGINGTGVVLDVGADPNEDGPATLPDFVPIINREIDHVFVTHAHHDHIGSLPALNEKWPMARLHLTSATRTLTVSMLYASARLQQRKFDEGSSPFRALFDEEDLEDVFDAFRAHPYGEWFDLQPGHIRTKFYYSGHLLGATGVLLATEDGRRIFYTSDTCVHNQTIIPGGSYPSEPVDILIMESTLGADPVAETITRAEEEIRFGERLAAVLNRGGTVLLPVFMLGRAQEILALLGDYKRRGIIDPETPIYSAGGLREVSRIYDDCADSTPRLDSEFKVYGVEQRQFPRSHKARRRALNQPGIHVLASGMMIEHTLSHKVAVELLEDEKHAIFFVGFAKEDLPAGKLLHAAQSGAEGVLLSRERGMQKIVCEVDRFRFSGHANRQDLAKLAMDLQPKTIILVHGETKARQWLAGTIREKCPNARVLTPGQGELFTI